MSTDQCTPGDHAPHAAGRERIAAARDRIRALAREGHESNLRRQRRWLGVQPGEVVAIQTLGPSGKDDTYLAFARSIEEAIELSKPGSLVAANRWGKPEQIPYQGIYVVGNRLVDRIDEVFAPGRWATMPKGVITDERIVARRMLYLDLDTQRTDSQGRPIDLPISATTAELGKTIIEALPVLDEITTALSAIGVERPSDAVAVMMSGNGIQFWLALADIPESPELHTLVRELLAIWAALYDSEACHVDTSVHDAKRIGPLAGTPKRKGVKRELHRRVTFDGADSPRRLTGGELQRLVSYYRGLLTPEQRAAVGNILGFRARRPKQAGPSRGGGLAACNEVPIREVAAKLGIDPEKPTCPGCGSGGKGSDVAFLDDRNLLNCKHSRCADRPNRTPVDLVAAVVFDCANISGTKGVAGRVLGWFRSNFGVGGRP